ncbi:hypothetical protein [Mycobacterium spongiae]|uniref:Uncharacterized protein n=1 Tax=Mycobacterium spongiae TaxID=886343 RepID=A0A975JXN3_9MYCO|nr:hypothetical protein [Mycobacterium spongiae]QUR67278.1 hypothetical protein F6B93_09350 [Mycobacterium spongiae]
MNARPNKTSMGARVAEWIDQVDQTVVTRPRDAVVECTAAAQALFRPQRHLDCFAEPTGSMSFGAGVAESDGDSPDAVSYPVGSAHYT